MRTLTLDGINYSLPGAWSEMNDWQLFTLAAAMRSARTLAELKLRLLLWYLEAHVTGRTGEYGELYTIQVGKNRHRLTATDLTTISTDIFAFLTKKVKHKKEVQEVIYSRLTRNPYPVLPCSCRVRLQGSADGLADITWEQFGLLQTYAKMMQKDRTANLDRLIAVLYRPKGKDFDPGNIEAYAEQVAKASPTHKEVILLYYYGCLDFLSTKFPATFSADGEPTTDAYSAHVSSVHALAQGDITKFPAVNSANLYDVLYNIENTINESEKRSQK